MQTFDDDHQTFDVSNFTSDLEMRLVRGDLDETVTRGDEEGIGIFDSFVSHFRVDDVVRILQFPFDRLEETERRRSVKERERGVCTCLSLEQMVVAPKTAATPTLYRQIRSRLPVDSFNVHSSLWKSNRTRRWTGRGKEGERERVRREDEPLIRREARYCWTNSFCPKMQLNRCSTDME